MKSQAFRKILLLLFLSFTFLLWSQSDARADKCAKFFEQVRFNKNIVYHDAHEPLLASLPETLRRFEVVIEKENLRINDTQQVLLDLKEIDFQKRGGFPALMGVMGERLNFDGAALSYFTGNPNSFPRWYMMAGDWIFTRPDLAIKNRERGAYRFKGSQLVEATTISDFFLRQFPGDFIRLYRLPHPRVNELALLNEGRVEELRSRLWAIYSKDPNVNPYSAFGAPVLYFSVAKVVWGREHEQMQFLVPKDLLLEWARDGVAFLGSLSIGSELALSDSAWAKVMEYRVPGFP